MNLNLYNNFIEDIKINIKNLCNQNSEDAKTKEKDDK